MKTVQKTKTAKYPMKTRTYFAVGKAEERLGLGTDLYLLTNSLTSRRSDNLKVYLDVLEGEQHEGVFPSAFMHGIVGVYVGEKNRKTSSSRVTW